MEILTGEQMQRVDRRAIETLGIPGLLLMESAGREVADALLRDYPDVSGHDVWILCGKGSNGGDGLVAARHLARRGVPPRVVLLARADELRGDPAVNLRALAGSGVRVQHVTDEAAWRSLSVELGSARVIVDALLGTGARGGAHGLVGAVVESLGGIETPIVSIDLPSGLDAGSGRVEGAVVVAERTYTLCRPKLPLVLAPAERCAGAWSVLPIGIPDAAVQDERPELEWLDAAAAGRLVTPREPDTHKGTWGHLLVVAGSRDKSGAAVLAGRGALGAGVGLATVALPESARALVAVQQAELMTTGLAEDGDGALAAGAAAHVLELLATRDALAIGPGLGTAPGASRAVREIVERRLRPAVVDADALNALADAAPRAPGRDAAALVLTPHPGEAARLLGCSTADVQADRLEAARRIARERRAVVVLKGHRTVVAAPDGRASFNASGNPAMATGGTGDVLTGAIGALLARGMEAWDAGRLAVFAHGLAGDMAATHVGGPGLVATDVALELPRALAELADAGEVEPW
jgi:NAD(P)H-hydrate epimerase